MEKKSYWICWEMVHLSKRHRAVKVGYIRFLNRLDKLRSPRLKPRWKLVSFKEKFYGILFREQKELFRKI
ncbi:hypothetical protein D3C74_478010 [compost metagenome]